MFASNDLFRWRSSNVTYRLLKANSFTDTAWIFDISPTGSHFPQRMVWSVLYKDFKSGAIELVKPTEDEETPAPSEAAKQAAQIAFTSIESLVFDLSNGTDVPRLREDIFEPSMRHRLIVAAAAANHLGISTLYTRLAKWWAGGQTAQALLPRYENRGTTSLLIAIRTGTRRTKVTCTSHEDTHSVTGNRGRPAKSGRRRFGWTKGALEKFIDYVKTALNAKPHLHLARVFDDYLYEHHYYDDENGTRHCKPEGERPSDRQMYYALEKLTTKDERLRARIGDREFEKNHAPKDGSTREVCDGIGHIYEIDGTIVDINVRSAKSRERIAGRPTLVLIVDRWSFLIVGFYLGFEADSWAASREAILSILEDKEELCRRYGVEYRKEDWPATGILCQGFVADRGPLAANDSSILVAPDISVAIKNLPAGFAKFKPHVECLFKLQHIRLETHDGYLPPPSKRRVGKKYELDATLTLHELTTKILRWIIDHNRKPGTTRRLRLDQLDRGVKASPLAIWEDETARRSGLLRRASASVGRAHLLNPRTASVTAEGIEHDGLYYTCPTAIRETWFDSTRKVTKVIVRADRRLCDSIYIEIPAGRGRVRHEVATLTGDSKQYAGLSMTEVAQYMKLRANAEADAKIERRDINFASKQRDETLSLSAKAATRKATRGRSAASQVKDQKRTRAEELRQERIDRLRPTPSKENTPATVYDFKSGGKLEAPQPTVSPLDVALMKVHNEMNDEPLSP